MILLFRLTDNIPRVTSCWKWRETRRSVCGSCGKRRRRPSATVKVTVAHSDRQTKTAGRLWHKIFGWWTDSRNVVSSSVHTHCCCNIRLTWFLNTTIYSLYLFLSLWLGIYFLSRWKLFHLLLATNYFRISETFQGFHLALAVMSWSTMCMKA